MDPVDSLADWLRTKALIHEDILEPTLEKLKAEEVFVVSDLMVLRQEGGLRDVFTRVSANKVEKALDALTLSDAPAEQPASRPQERVLGKDAAQSGAEPAGGSSNPFASDSGMSSASDADAAGSEC